MRVTSMSGNISINQYTGVGKPRVRPAVDEYSQFEKAAETFGFINVLDAEIARQAKEKKVYSDIVAEKRKRKVNKI